MALIDLPNGEEDIASQAGPSRRPPSLHLSEAYLSAHTSRHVPRSLSTSTTCSARSAESPYNSDAINQTSCSSEFKFDDSEDLLSELSDINLNVEQPDSESTLDALEIPLTSSSNDTIYVCLDDQDEAWYSNLSTTNQPLEIASFRVTTRRSRAPSISRRRATPQAMHAALEGLKGVQLDVDLGRQRISSNELGVHHSRLCDNLHDFTWISCGTGINSSLPSEAFPWRTLRDDLPWGQLTHISMDCPLAVADIHHVLSTSSNLKSLTLNLKSPDWPDQPSSPSSSLSSSSITAPLLQTLSITSTVDLHSLFADVVMPALTHLTLDVAPNGLGLALPGEKASIDAGLNIPWEQLQALDIQYRCFEPCHLSPVLSRLRSMRKLSLDGLPDTLDCGNMPIPVLALDSLAIGRGVQPGSIITTFADIRVSNLRMTQCAFDLQQVENIAPSHIYLSDSISASYLLDVLLAIPDLETGEFSIQDDDNVAHSSLDIVPTTLSSLRLIVNNNSIVSSLLLRIKSDVVDFKVQHSIRPV